MDVSVPIPTRISSVSFSIYSSEQIRAISVKQIVNSQLFDNTGRPALGGLYDPALGPVEKNDLCSTCHLTYFACPGHFGHIELPAPVFHPLLLAEVYALIRITCLYCHRIRLHQNTVKYYCGQFQLLEAGLLEDAERMFEAYSTKLGTNALAAKGKKNIRTTEQDGEKEKAGGKGQDDAFESASSESTTAFIEEYVRAALAREEIISFGGPLTSDEGSQSSRYKPSVIVGAKKELKKNFMKLCIGTRQCKQCNAWACKMRKEGSTRVWQKTLTAKQANSHDLLGLRRRPVEALEAERQRLLKGSQTADGSQDSHTARAAAEALVNGNGYHSSDDDDDNSGSEESDVDAIPSPELQSVEAIAKKSAQKAADAQKEKVMLPSEARAHLRLLFMKEQEIYSLIYGTRGFLKVSNSAQSQRNKRPQVSADMFFVEVLPVSPTRFRPAGSIGEMKFENPQNDLLNKVINTSALIREIPRGIRASKKQAAVGTSTQSDLEKAYAQLLESINTLQIDVNSLMDSSKNPMVLRGGKLPPPGIRQALEKKEGLFRKHMMGKRVNYAARSVISPDPNLETNEIGVPPIFASTLTYPEPVTRHNFHTLRQAVINGPKTWPGAVAVKDEDGRIQHLGSLSESSRTAIANQLLTPSGRHAIFASGPMDSNGVRTSTKNKKVYRHLVNGDYLIMNRQPTLHRPSMMAHKARVLPGEKTIRMHYANCNGYNADFDGDEMNMHFPQNEIARAEAAHIASTDNQYLVPTSGTPIRGLIQDHVVSGVWITKKDQYFTRAEYQQLLFSALRPEDLMTRYGNINLLPPAILKPRTLWTGKQIISSILSNIAPVGSQGLNLISKAKIDGKAWGFAIEESSVQFFDGELVTGVLDKAQFGATAYGLVHSVHEIYGPVTAGRLLSILGRLFTAYTQWRGFTCGIDDLGLTPEGDKLRSQILQDGSRAGLEASAAYVGLDANSRMDEGQLNERLEEVLRDNEKMAGLDSAMKGRMNQLTSDVIKQCIPSGLDKSFPNNNMQMMTVSGAKGSNVNVSQISCLLGQQELEGRRVPTMISGKTLPSFRAFATSARAGGYVAGRFLTGIKPQEYYFHCMAGREGLIDTAVKTSRSGYLQRCLIKHLEGVRTHYDQTVRDSDGSVIQFNYGEDSLDVIKQKHLYQFEFAVKNVSSLVQQYHLDQVSEATNANSSQIKKLSKLALRNPKNHDPVLSKFNPSCNLGAVSEKFRLACIEWAEKDTGKYIIDQLGEEHSDDGEKPPESAILNLRAFEELMNSRYLRATVEPGEAVGLLASQSVGEPSTQMTLNTFHFAGFGAKNVTLGIPRLREIIMTASASIKTPTMTLPLADGVTDAQAQEFCKIATKVTLCDVIDDVTVVEQLTSKAGSEDFSRVRQYRTKIRFFPKDEIIEHYGIGLKDIMSSLHSEFPHYLDHYIAQSLKSSETRRKAAGTSIGKASRITDEYAANADHLEGEDHAAAAADDSDDDDLGTALQEGDGDATDARMASRAKEHASYDDLNSEEGENADDQLRDELEADLEERYGADVDGMSAEEEGGDARSEEGQARQYEMREWEEEVSEASQFMTRFSYDSDDGAYAEFEIELSPNMPKLLLMGIIEKAVKASVIRRITGIERCFAVTNEAENDTSRSLATEGVSFQGIWDAGLGVIGLDHIYSNDIAAILRTYGVEAARQAICKEISGVFGVYHIDVAPAHISLIADFMTFGGGYRAFNRVGIESCSSVLQQASFETSTHFVTNATLQGDYDDLHQANLTSPSASLVLGQPVGVGTGSFSLVAPLK